MEYRLGDYRPEQSSNHLLAALAREGRLGVSAQGIQELLLRLSEAWQAKVAGLPDLLAQLPVGDEDREWVKTVHEVMRERRVRGTRVGLLQCQREDEGAWTGIAVIDPHQSGSVRPGDLVYGGFVALRDDEGLAVFPRIFRQVCRNGLVVGTVLSTDVVGQHADLRSALQACLSREHFDATVQRLQFAAQMPVADEIGLLRQARVRALPREVLDAHEERDPTVYGVINAVTALARQADTLHRRVELERAAGRILQTVGVGARLPPRRILPFARRDLTPCH